VPSLLPLLDDDEVRLRRATAHLLAWFPRWASRSLPLLRARLAAESDLDAKATTVVALGLLAGGRGETRDRPRLEQLLGWLTGVTTAGRHPEILFPEPEQYAMLIVESVPALRERAVEAIFDRLATMPSLEARPLVRNLKDLALKDLPDDPAAFPPLAKRVLGSLVWPLGRWD
jgi:hypothetical protein